MITTIKEWVKYNESMFVSKKLDTRKEERLKQLTSEFNKQFKIGEVYSILIESIFKINSNFKLPDNLTTSNFLDLTNTKITELPNNLTIKGSLNINGLKLINKLPMKLKVYGPLFASNTSIEFLPNDLMVRGDVDVYNTPLAKNIELINKYKERYKILYKDDDELS